MSEFPTPSRWLYAMLAVYVVSAVVVTIQHGVIDHENNFAIFRAAWPHLVAGRDLYAPDPAHYDDLLKYSPTFALLFAPFAILPFPVGLLLWNLVNALTLAGAVALVLPPRRAAIALALAFWEMVGSLQRSQSNALVAGLIVAAFAAIERDRIRAAAVAIATGVCIKIYPLAALVCAVPRRRALRATAWTVVVLVALVALPAFVVPGGIHGLLAQYRSWRAVEAIDALEGMVPPGRRATGLNGGVMQLLRVCCDVRWPNWAMQVIGTVVLLVPLALKRAAWDDRRWRLWFLASVLVYALLFNHQAESPSYIVGMAGIGIWYAAGPLTRARTAFALALLFAISAPGTGILTHAFYREVFIRYALKTVPVTLAWIAIQADLFQA